MQVVNKVTAQYLALGLELGICDLKHVSSWVDSEIERIDSVDGPLLELSYLKNKNTQDVIATLLGMPATEEHWPVLRRLLASIPKDDLDNKGFCRQLARALFDEYLKAKYEVPDDFSEIGFFEDDYELANKGIGFASTNEWHANFIGFIEQFKIR